MKKPFLNPRFLIGLAIAMVFGLAQAAGIDTAALAAQHTDVLVGISMLMVGDMEAITKAMDRIEAAMKANAEKAAGEMATLGKVSTDTKTAVDALGVEQRTLADRLLQLEQKGAGGDGDGDANKPLSWGEQLIKNAHYAAFAGGQTGKLRMEVKNTLVGSDTNVAPNRLARIVGGAMLPFSMEALLPSTTTTSNAIEFTKENVFTNAAAEAAEGAAKAESSLTWTLVNMPVSTVAHWIKISRQLAMDAPALAAYVNSRMVYGVNQKVDTQLVVGDGTAPNISGTYDTGNYTAHGYTDAALTAISSTFKRLVLIRKVIADLYVAGYPADAIVLNPQDWATIEIQLMTTAAGQTLYSVSEGGTPRLFGLPVIQAIGMAADTFQVGRFSEAYMVHNREGVTVEMSDSDSDNFTKNLITLRAERRLALATEKPAAVRGGDLTPA